MPNIGIRELARHVSRLVGDVERSGEPALITRHGRPVAMIVPVNAEAVEELVLARAPDLIAARQDANAELVAGTTRSLDTVIVAVDVDETPTARTGQRAAVAR